MKAGLEKMRTFLSMTYKMVTTYGNATWRNPQDRRRALSEEVGKIQLTVSLTPNMQAFLSQIATETENVSASGQKSVYTCFVGLTHDISIFMEETAQKMSLGDMPLATECGMYAGMFKNARSILTEHANYPATEALVAAALKIILE